VLDGIILKTAKALGFTIPLSSRYRSSLNLGSGIEGAADLRRFEQME
jgi:hypothetical protein